MTLIAFNCINFLKKSRDSQPLEGVWKWVFHTNESASTVDVGGWIWYGFWVLHEHFGQWLLESIVRIGQHQLHDSSLSLNLQLATSVLPTRKPRVSKTSWTHFRIQNLSGNYLVWTSRNGFKHSSWTCRQIFPNNQRHFSWGDIPLAAGRIKNASTFGMNFALVEAPVTVWNPRNPGEKKFTGKKRVKSKQQTD